MIFAMLRARFAVRNCRQTRTNFFGIRFFPTTLGNDHLPLLGDGDGKDDLAVGLFLLGNRWDPGKLDPLEGLIQIIEKTADIDPGIFFRFSRQKILYVLLRPGNAHTQPSDNRDDP